MSNDAVPNQSPADGTVSKKDADYVFYELTRSICPKCRRVIDAKIVLRDNKVFMRKRCPDCGSFEALVYADAEATPVSASSTSRGRSRLPTERTFEKGVPTTAVCAPTTNSTHVSASSRSTAPATWIARFASRKPVPDSA